MRRPSGACSCRQEPSTLPLANFSQVLKGLRALHDEEIMHRDLKSANVFLNTDLSVKLGDLNVSKIAKMGMNYTQTGTPYYASPEVWREQPYDMKSDVWSLGCVIYEMLALKPPFRAQNMKELYKKVLRGNFPTVPSQFSDELGKTIASMIQVNPKHRPTCAELLEKDHIKEKLLLYFPDENGHSNDRSYGTFDSVIDRASNRVRISIHLPSNIELEI